MKTIWVEVLLVTAIILIPASLALRIIYGQQWLTWEYNLIESWGINRIAYDLIKTGILIIIAGCFLIRQKRKQKKDESQFYELPKP